MTFSLASVLALGLDGFIVCVGLASTIHVGPFVAGEGQASLL